MTVLALHMSCRYLLMKHAAVAVLQQQKARARQASQQDPSTQSCRQRSVQVAAASTGFVSLQKPLSSSACSALRGLVYAVFSCSQAIVPACLQCHMLPACKPCCHVLVLPSCNAQLSCSILPVQLAKGPVRVGAVSGHAITIKDVSAEAAAANGSSGAANGTADAATAADEDYARRLQAKMDAQAMGGGK